MRLLRENFKYFFKPESKFSNPRVKELRLAAFHAIQLAGSGKNLKKILIFQLKLGNLRLSRCLGLVSPEEADAQRVNRALKDHRKISSEAQI